MEMESDAGANLNYYIFKTMKLFGSVGAFLIIDSNNNN